MRRMLPLLLLAASGTLATGGCGDAATSFPLGPAGRSSAVTFTLVPTIAFTSTRADPTASPFVSAEIYLMDPEGADVRRITDNEYGDAFPALSPDGRKIVFDTNRLREPDEPVNTSDLFLMDRDGSDPVWLTRGSSASWSPDGTMVAFHASASGEGQPIRPDPGSATTDSDIFTMAVDDDGGGARIDLTNDPAAVDDDPDWSADGRLIAFTSHSVDDNQQNSATAEIFAIAPDGSGRRRLTFNSEEERGPTWSPDGSRIAFSCRRGGPDFEICVMDADGSNQVQLTDNAQADLTATWVDDHHIVFHRVLGPGNVQLFEIDADAPGTAIQLTAPPGANLFPHFGQARLPVR